MDVAAGELDNEHQEGGCNPLSVVIPRTCCQSQSACNEYDQDWYSILKQSVVHNNIRVNSLDKIFEFPQTVPIFINFQYIDMRRGDKKTGVP